MIYFFTIFKKAPLHPRLEMQLQWLKEQGWQTTCFFGDEPQGIWYKWLNKLTWKLVRWDLIQRNRKKIQPGSVVHIYDFTLLRLAKYAKRKGCTVVYETLDDNVYLHLFSIRGKGSFFRWIAPLLERKLVAWEKHYCDHYCDHVIINSPNLAKIAPGKAKLIYYASPFEGFSIPAYEAQKETVLLYLGKLTTSKGAAIYQDLVKQTGLNMHFFGEAKDRFSKQWITEDERVVHHGNKNSAELNAALADLAKRFNLVGLSIIIPDNESYALQEANKDIDYLCIGLPFIGNERKPTKEKIDAGAGVLYTDAVAIQRLINNENGWYDQMSKRQKELYSEQYSKTIFFERFATVYPISIS